jgi:hypothetical protein
MAAAILALSTLAQVIPEYVGILLAIAALLNAVLTYVQSRQGQEERAGIVRDLTLVQIADRLAIAVNKQWHDEARLRRLNDPHPLPVAWHPADPDLVEPWHALRLTATGWSGGPPTDPAGWASSPAQLAGADNDLADRLGPVCKGS